MHKTLLLIVLLAAAMAHSLALAHDADEPLYVAPDGIDSGECQDAASPCRTIGYAMRWLGKGGQIRVARGSYRIADAEDLFHLLGGAFDVRGG